MRKIELKHIVNEKEDNVKISSILINQMNISNRLLIKLKMNEKILVNKKPVYSNYIVHKDDIIIVKIDFEEEDYITPEKMDLNILYEDDYFLAINKPAGIVVHPSANHLTNTLANGVKYYLSNKKRIRPINRLDRDTSGIVLFAKNEYIQEIMNKKNNITKEYLAIIYGTLENKEGIIDKPISRKNGSIMEREVSANGQVAITKYKVIDEIKIDTQKISLLDIQLETRANSPN